MSTARTIRDLPNLMKPHVAGSWSLVPCRPLSLNSSLIHLFTHSLLHRLSHLFTYSLIHFFTAFLTVHRLCDPNHGERKFPPSRGLIA